MASAQENGRIAKIEFGPASFPWRALIRSKVPLPKWIKITWLISGETITIDPYILSDGAGRDVIGGIDKVTGAQVKLVLKVLVFSHNHKDMNHMLLLNSLTL